MSNIKNTDVIKFNGAIYTPEEFIEEFVSDENKNIGMDIIDVLIKKGDVVILDDKTAPQKKIEKALKQEVVVAVADNIDASEEKRLDNKAAQKREGKLVYPKIKLKFNSYNNANNAKNYIEKNLRIKNITIAEVDTCFLMTVENVTDDELRAINNYYKLGKFTGMLVDGAGKVVRKTTDGIDYTAKNIVAPITEIGTRGVMSVFSSLVSVVSHTGAALVTATTKGIKDSKENIVNDTEVIRATRDLINAKDSIKKSINNKTNSIGGGIEIEY